MSSFDIVSKIDRSDVLNKDDNPKPELACGVDFRAVQPRYE
jgi:uncharacterized protein YajQ (UPF0234 family)